jgi:hypothetical protein
VIASSNKGLRRSNNNSKKQRWLAIVRLKGKLKLRLLKQGVRLELRLEYQGKQRRLVRLLIELHDRQLVELNNDSNKLKKLPKRARNAILRLPLRQL